MKIILSPSKTQNSNATIIMSNKPLFNEKLTFNLFKNFKKVSKKSLEDQIKIKGKLLDEIYEYYHRFQVTDTMTPVLDCYQGVAFSEIKYENFNDKQLSYMNNHLRILSAMYGVIEPDTNIWTYRLDMNAKPAGINLYKYWQEAIDEYFKDEDVIINLASSEFSRMIKSKKDIMINIHFKEEQKDGSLKVISYNSKKARGQMVHALISNQINEVEKIKDLHIDGYELDEAISDSCNYYFVKAYLD